MVISTWVLEHLRDPAGVVQAAWQALSPSGLMLLFFETSMPGWRQRVLGPLWRKFEVELVPDEVLSRLPGIRAIERFGGPGPRVIVARLEKQEPISASRPGGHQPDRG